MLVASTDLVNAIFPCTGQECLSGPGSVIKGSQALPFVGLATVLQAVGIDPGFLGSIVGLPV